MLDLNIESSYLDILIENLSDAIILTDEKFKINNWNKAAEIIYGWEAKEVIGRQLDDFLKRIISLKNFNTLIKNLFNKGFWKGESIQKRKDGKDIYLQSFISLIKNDNGEVLGTITINHDITRQKESEQQFRETEKKYRDLFNGMSSGVAVYEAIEDGIDFNFKDINKAGEKISKVKKEEIIGKSVKNLFPGVISSGLFDMFKRVYEEGKPIRHPVTLYKDERISHWMENYIYKLSSGEIIAVYDDLTDIKVTEEKLNKLNEELEKMVEERTKKLRESEEKYRNLFEGAYDSIFIMENNRFIECNKMTLNMFGCNNENEIIGYYPWDFSPAKQPDGNDSKTKALEYLDNAINGKSQRFYWKHINKKNGNLFDADVSLSRTLIDEKYYIQAIVRDITERVKAEQKLKESEEKYRHLFNKSPLSILLFNQEGNLIDANLTSSQIFPRFDIKVNIGKNFTDILSIAANSEELLKVFIKRYKDFAKGKELKPFEFKIIRPHGEEIWVNWQSSKLQLNNEPIIQVIIQDITVNKKAEEKIKESEEKFRGITEQSLLGICIYQDDAVQYLNQKIADIFEYTIEEVLNWKPGDFINLISPEYRDFIIEQVRKKQIGKKDVLTHYIFKGIKKKGEEIWLEIYSKTIEYGGRNADLITLIDITEKKEAERLIVEENKKLLELDRMRSDLITRISHELKTPLTSAYLASQILLTSYMEKMDEAVLNFVQTIHRGNIRLKSLIENLLDASRIESQKFKLVKHRENIANLINECIQDLIYFINKRQLKLNLNLPKEIYMHIDRIRIEQVFINIISNAIKNTPVGGEIYFDFEESSDYIDFKVKDTGIGFTTKEKEKLFQKFGKIERYGMGLDVDIEGSGLGLYISKHIIEQHNGEILVESEGRNKGSTFIIRLNKNK